MNIAQHYSKNDSLIFKGFAIMLIILHNYLHWQAGFAIENENGFLQENVFVFLKNLFPFRWTDSLSAFFGFLGHYGVQLFIFISAYGLTVQMMKTNSTDFSYWKYLFRRLKKLYFLLFFGIILYQIIFVLRFGELYSLKNTLVKTILLCTSVSNFSKTYNYKMISGPFWFFGLMVQLYVVFPLLYQWVKKHSIYVIFLISFLLIYLLYWVDRQSDFSVFGNLIGHLPEVFLGIYFALNKITKPSKILFFTSILVFILSQFYWFVFPFSFISVTVILLYLVGSVKSVLNQFWTEVLLYIGKISMILFITNGMFRILSIFDISDMSLRGERIFLYLILLFITSHFLYKLYEFLFRILKIQK